MSDTIRFTIYCGLAVGSDMSPSTIRRSRELVYRFADENLQGFTITEGIGRWGGKNEPTTIVTFITDKATDITKVNSFCHSYKWNNHQESVLYTEEKVSARFY
jgi:hypothetical protein